MVAPPAAPVDSAPIGTLWTMRRSPYSACVTIVLNLSARSAHQMTYIPLLSALPMRLRLGFRAGKITCPILQTHANPGTFLCDSFEICKYIDSVREPSRPSLFPADNLSVITEFNQHANALRDYMRARLISLLQHDLDAAAALFAPRVLRNWFFTRAFIRVALFLFARKYTKESASASRNAARDGLVALRSRLAQYSGDHLRYICSNRLTYADVVVTESMFFDPQRHGRYAYLYVDEQLEEEFPDLIAWARAIRRTHYPTLFSKKKA